MPKFEEVSSGIRIELECPHCGESNWHFHKYATTPKKEKTTCHLFPFGCGKEFHFDCSLILEKVKNGKSCGFWE